MSAPFRPLIVLLLVVAAAALVAAGRWEGSRHAEEENRDIARIRALVGPLDSPTLEAYRLLPRFSCLLYERGATRFALELCFDGEGRVIEAIDRRGEEPQIASIREEPGAAAVTVDRAEVDRLIRRLQAAEPERSKT